LEKRLPIALLLSFLVLFLWTNFAAPPPLPEEAGGTEAPIELAESEFDADRELVGERAAASEEQEFSVQFGTPGEAGSYLGRFTNRGARLLSLKIGDYTNARGLDDEERRVPSEWVEVLSSVETASGMSGSLVWSGGSSAKSMLTEPLEDALWIGSELEGGGIEFSYAPGTGVVFKKRVLPVANSHELRLELEIENEGAGELADLAQFSFTPADVVRPVGNERFYSEPQTLATWRMPSGEYEVETAIQKSGGSDLTGSLPGASDAKLAFAGVHNKFFAFLMAPATEDIARNVMGVSYRRVQDAGWLRENPEEEGDAWKYVVCDMALKLELPAQGEAKSWAFDLYAGPKQREILGAVKPVYTEMLDEDIGMFSGIAKIITAILGFYHGVLGNWGWAIILMTLTVRGLLFPLNRRFQTAMARYAKKMKRVQPLIDAVKEKYKNDPKRLREEQSRIMQEEGAIPPLGGCLPMLLQFPIFIGLFQALRVDFDLRHQPFILWMEDLSLPDQLLRLDLNTHLPFIGTIEYLNILPLLMIGLWITQHKVMPQPENTGPDQERMKKMMMGMQVFFAFLFYSYASGLALYMITSSSLAIFETVVIKKVWPIDDSELAKKPPGKFAQKVAAMQKEQLRRAKEQQAQGKSGGSGKKGKKRK
jgi:YidC/Oxa1 family membrane protein insertase